MLLGILGVAQADLARIGPIDPANGYPAWYQDKTGLVLDLCLPNATDLLNGNCLLLPADIPTGTAPESFPANFAEEHFYWNATSLMTVAGGGRATLVLALEGAFGNGPVLDGDQMVFSRIRVLVDVPEPGGTYTVTHPYGVEVFPNVAPGTRAIFFTEDIGLAPGIFTTVLNGRVGPFLVAADPLGNPLPPVVLPGGNTFLADPNFDTQVTGSPFGTNFFRIEGPNIGGPGINMIETDLFSLMGKVHTAPVAALLDVSRATYARDAVSAQIDVFATSAAAIGGPQPLLSVSGPNIPSRLMENIGSKYYTTIIPAAPGDVPASIIVTNNGDALPTLNEANLVDELTAQASWDAVTGNLTIQATSSDQLVPPVMVASDDQGRPLGTLVGGQLTVPGKLIPPPRVTVKSSAGGVITTNVMTGGVAIQGPAVADDAVTTTENIPVSVAVLANDGASADPTTVTVIGQPQNGSVVVDATGNSTYTPNLSFAGVDTFTYLVKDINGNASNLATVTITVTNIPNPPVAVDDSTIVPVNNSVVIDVLANDTDPDGDIVPGSVVIVTAPVDGTATVNPDGTISYVAGPSRTVDVIQYQVTDATGLVSNIATVVIDVLFPESITVQKAEVKVTDWRIQGDTTIPGPNNTITVHVGPDLTGPVLGTALVDNVGGWQLQVRNSGIFPDATQTISMESSQGGTRLAVPVAVK